MIWTTRKLNKKHWHLWFAWYPIVVKRETNGEIVTTKCWWENVKRKEIRHQDSQGGYWEWEYCTTLTEAQKAKSNV